MRSNVWKLSTLAFAGALCLVVGRDFVQSASADPQPNMVTALEELNSAKGHLENATHDKGGHRAKAMDAVKVAIAEVKAGIDFDNRH